MKDKEKQKLTFEQECSLIANGEDLPQAKQIEENGKALYSDLSSIMSEEYEKRSLITPSFCANKLLDLGYRNCKDKVVLSKQEFEILAKTARGKIGNMKTTDFLKACISSGVMVEVSTEEQGKQAYEKGSKETAEKILKDVLELFPKDKHFTTVSRRTIYNIAKQFGVEIKE